PRRRCRRSWEAMVKAHPAPAAPHQVPSLATTTGATVLQLGLLRITRRGPEVVAIQWGGRVYTREECVRPNGRRLTQVGLDLLHAVYAVNRQAEPFLHVRASRVARGEFFGFRPEWFVVTTPEFREKYKATKDLKQTQISCKGNRAKAVLIARGVEALAIDALEPPPLTVGELFSRFRAALPNLSKKYLRMVGDEPRTKTIQRYEIALDHFAATVVSQTQVPMGGGKKQVLRVEHLRTDLAGASHGTATMKRLAHRGVAKDTQYQYRCCLKVPFTWGADLGYLVPDGGTKFTDEIELFEPTVDEPTPRKGFWMVNTAQAGLLLGCPGWRVIKLALKEEIESVLTINRRYYFISEQVVRALQERQGWPTAIPDFIPQSVCGREFFSMPEFGWLIDFGFADEPEELRLCCEILATMGFRPSELAGIGEFDIVRCGPYSHPDCLGDCDLEPSVGYVTARWQFRRKGKFREAANGYLKFLKNGRKRDVYFGQHILRMLDRLLEINREKRRRAEAAGHPWPTLPHGMPLFCGDDGLPMSIDLLNQVLGRALLRAGFPADRCIELARAHKLRHLAGSEHYRLTGNSKLTADFLGDTREVVEKTYIHIAMAAEGRHHVQVQESAATQAQRRKVAETGVEVVLDEQVGKAQAAARDMDGVALAQARRQGDQCIRQLFEIYEGRLPSDARAHVHQAVRRFDEAEAYLDRDQPGWRAPAT
ncbi:MAG: hypothetical protein WB802_02290, partial [Candidatus Dormiibacterota bacterium]